MELTLQRGAIPVDLDRRRVLFFDHAGTWLLLQKYGPRFLPALYRIKDPKSFEFELVSMDALAFFLYVGLQADAKAHGEEVTLEQAQGFLHPWSYAGIFRRIVLAVVGATATPDMSLGKSEADGGAAQPAAEVKAAPPTPGPTRVATTSMKRSASLSSSSAGRRMSSGARRRSS